MKGERRKLIAAGGSPWFGESDKRAISKPGAKARGNLYMIIKYGHSADYRVKRKHIIYYRSCICDFLYDTEAPDKLQR